MINAAIFPTAYLPPVQYYSKLAACPEAVFELYENFPKQTYRNRSYIMSPNGKQMLVVPLKSRRERTITRDIRISYNDNWQKLHWRSMEAAYRRSAYFEYYENDLLPFYSAKKFEFLVDLNLELIQLINSLLKIKMNPAGTISYEEDYADLKDYRSLLSPKVDFHTDPEFIVKPYPQVFDTKQAFIPNLSIVDLLFNQGPRSVDYFTGPLPDKPKY
jgi:hypothetical protein